MYIFQSIPKKPFGGKLKVKVVRKNNHPCCDNFNKTSNVPNDPKICLRRHENHTLNIVFFELK